MSEQVFEAKNRKIREQFIFEKRKYPSRFERTIDLSWSIWMFGTEPFRVSLERLSTNGLKYVEIKGDHLSKDSGMTPEMILSELSDFNMKVSGTCGLFGEGNDLSSIDPLSRKNAIAYIRKEIEVLKAVDGRYLIVVPSAVGRPEAADSQEMERSAEALRECARDFNGSGVAAGIEPIRSAEVSLVNSVDDALAYIARVGESSISCVNADTYHMSLEEAHIGEAIIKLGNRLVNLHLADTNRDGLGRGMLDLDTVIMASYLVGMNREGRFLTPEPLGPFPDPYVLSTMPCDTEVMDKLVADTVQYFRERETFIRSL
ncbi:sugar phosphate isomerase/epimerase [Oceanispirochaeta sp.]|jgi:D-psicose/D-tagatose/L-ribulose 3-epimerase|uniref:sugar phosphate isomerase/epimerase family protein n=1 Tax=Oceanispirochaeta sp. TaxID=2035350 RepID=UPI0026175E33|nr:sugar phosphate isomerase/epimerase family protein [Oceanispirochaeta sp.]MDA3958290.1 sugar phosphate isomerase/epimerase [Oceanispirochaeta sp.]